MPPRRWRGPIACTCFPLRRTWVLARTGATKESVASFSVVYVSPWLNQSFSVLSARPV
jgi:hypothetical protein